MLKRNIVVISEAGPPVGATIAEGGSLRAWGIAKSLADAGHRVTFLYRVGYEHRVDQQSIDKIKDINFGTWDPATGSNKFLEKAHVVIVRHSHAEASMIVEKLASWQMLVVDCYVPIHVEVSARDADDKLTEYRNFLQDDIRWNRIVTRGDYFLYASENQKLYLLGFLAGILLLNPLTYRELESRLIKLPYCYFAHEEQHRIEKENTNVSILWYGGLYAWFDIGSLVPAIIKLREKHANFKFILAGARNPYIGDVSLIRAYEAQMKKLEPIRDCIIEVPYQSYDQRFATYADASAIVYVNKPGLENSLAWRTRLVDYILAKKPILTNGGDPLGEELIADGLAFRFDPSRPATLSEALELALETNIDSAYTQSFTKYSWEESIKGLNAVIVQGTTLKSQLVNYTQIMKLARATRTAVKVYPHKKIINYYRVHGFKKTVHRLAGARSK